MFFSLVKIFCSLRPNHRAVITSRHNRIRYRKLCIQRLLQLTGIRRNRTYRRSMDYLRTMKAQLLQELYLFLHCFLSLLTNSFRSSSSSFASSASSASSDRSLVSIYSFSAVVAIALLFEACGC